MAVNGLENALKYAMNNPHAEEAKGDFLKPEDSDETPAMDDESTANLVTMFTSVCKAFAVDPKAALAILVAHDFEDDLDAMVSRFRVV